MTQPFSSFVIFAQMRTGSNLLEATLNAIPRIVCMGEAFNPYMMGWPDTDTLCGFTRDQREADPHALLRAIQDSTRLRGFRYFHDHDPRVFDAIMDDRACAKIVLTRNPLDSFVSTRLAWETNQWKLNETETPIPAAITFDGAEFRQTLDQIEAFLARVQHQLQVTGQTAFWLNYDDLRDARVITGMLHWLGRTDLDTVRPASDQVPQNPREMARKVRNFDEMQDQLARLDPFALHRIPTFEPQRGPAVPSFIGADAGAGLIFMPVRGGPTAAVRDWLSGLGDLTGEFTQSSLRQWKRAHPGHRGFTVLRHPLRRALDAFRSLLTDATPELRHLMRRNQRVDLPEDGALADLAPEQFAALFRQFLDFLRRNLNGQTTLPTPPGWATQTEVLAGFARFATPDAVLREDRLADEIAGLLRSVGSSPAKAGAPATVPPPDWLSDPDLIAAARAAYQRDYVMFGFPDAPSA